MQTKHYYKLEGHTPVPVATFEEWSSWRTTANTQVITSLTESAVVSTVFLGLNQSVWNDHPLVFETLVSGGKLDGKKNRYSTWDEAVQGHFQILVEVIARS